MLTKKIADEIVHETSIRLKRNINIMDIDGIIIAAKDSSRIGFIHEGAIEVLHSGNSLTIHSIEDRDWKVSQPGVNLPIVFQEETIGVIGITGNPDEIHELGALVKMTTELMIKQEFIAKQLEWRQRTKEMIVEELLKKSPSYRNIQRGLNLLHFEFRPPYLIVMIQIKKRSISNQEVIQIIEKIVGKEFCFVSFTNANRLIITICGLQEDVALQNVYLIHRKIKKKNILFKMAYSLPFHELQKFRQSYLDCELTLKISDDSQELISFTQIEVKSLIYQLDETLATRFLKRILQHDHYEITLETLKAFFNNSLNIQKAADSLFIHRNTLIYRLNKITNDTGYNPRSFNDALNLQVAMWILEKNK